MTLFLKNSPDKVSYQVIYFNVFHYVSIRSTKE